MPAVCDRFSQWFSYLLLSLFRWHSSVLIQRIRPQVGDSHLVSSLSICVDISAARSPLAFSNPLALLVGLEWSFLVGLPLVCYAGNVIRICHGGQRGRCYQLRALRLFAHFSYLPSSPVPFGGQVDSVEYSLQILQRVMSQILVPRLQQRPFLGWACILSLTNSCSDVVVFLL